MARKRKRKQKKTGLWLGAAVLAILIIVGGGFAAVTAHAIAEEEARLAQLDEINKNLTYALEDMERYATMFATDAELAKSKEGTSKVKADVDKIKAKMEEIKAIMIEGEELVSASESEYAQKTLAAYAEYETAMDGYQEGVTEMERVIAYVESLDSVSMDTEDLKYGQMRIDYTTEYDEARREITAQQQRLDRIKAAMLAAKEHISFGSEDEFVTYLNAYSSYLDTYLKMVDALEKEDINGVVDAYEELQSKGTALLNPPSMSKYTEGMEKWFNETLYPLFEDADEHMVKGDRLMEEAEELR